MASTGRGELEAAIRRLLVSELEVDAAAVAATDSSTPLLGRGVGLDSMEAMALVVALEREFDVHFDDAELTAPLFASLGALADRVAEKLGAADDWSA
jgi:acyl carrier protein